MILFLVQSWFKNVPLRVKRLVRHLFSPYTDPYIKGLQSQNRFVLVVIHYIFELPLIFFDILGMPEWFAFMQRITKPEARDLHDFELDLAKTIFQDNISWDRVRLDENARLGTHGGKYAFVTYFYINCIGHMSLPILIHELVHVLQYQQEGSKYAFRNMVAHFFPNTYNYGGLEKLEYINANPSLIHLLNYEQRADVFSDYARLLLGQRPEWGNARLKDGITYFKVMKLLLTIGNR